MMKELKFAFYAIKKNMQSNAELRTSFLMNIFGMAINNLAFVFLWIYFVKSVGIIGGWTTYDIIGLNGFAALSYGIVLSMCMGIRKLPEYVSSGSFDRFMLSPKNILIRVATSAFSSSAVGDIIFGIICLIVCGLFVHVSVIQIIFIILLVIFASVVFLALSIIVYTLSFFFVDAMNITDGMFQFFFTPTLFHGGAFQGVLRFIFTFIVPSLLVAALPIETIKSVSFLHLFGIGILSFVWLFVSIKVFNRAIKRYESSNFMTFGN